MSDKPATGECDLAREATAKAEATKDLRDQLSDGYRMTQVAIAEAQKPLVDALTLVRKALCSGGGLREATDIIDDALARVGK
jgi:ribosomal protein L7/L12